jgi:hypothetical protein
MNPDWYEVELAFEELPNHQVDWGTKRKVSLGDNVLIYLSEPTHEIRVAAKVVKILVEGDKLIDDSKYIKPNCPQEIRDPFKFGRSVVRLQLIKFLHTGTGFDLKSFRKICGYRGCFMSDFCLNNTKNINFKNYLLQRL